MSDNHKTEIELHPVFSALLWIIAGSLLGINMALWRIVTILEKVNR